MRKKCDWCGGDVDSWRSDATTCLQCENDGDRACCAMREFVHDKSGYDMSEFLKFMGRLIDRRARPERAERSE